MYMVYLKCKILEFIMNTHVIWNAFDLDINLQISLFRPFDKIFLMFADLKPSASSITVTPL